MGAIKDVAATAVDIPFDLNSVITPSIDYDMAGMKRQIDNATVPIDVKTNGIFGSINNQMSAVLSRLDTVTKVLNGILAKNPNIVLDSGVLVGEIAPQMNNELGNLAFMGARG
jgi:hypothetical protein